MEREQFEKAVTNVGVTEKLEKRVVQKQGRVDIPDDWWEHMGLEDGESIFLKYDEDEKEVRIFEADPEIVRK